MQRFIALVLLTLAFGTCAYAKKHDPSEFTLQAHVISQGQIERPGQVEPPLCSGCGQNVINSRVHVATIDIASLGKEYEVRGHETKSLTLDTMYAATLDGNEMLIMSNGKVLKVRITAVRLIK
jgi:hypothetical protein